MKAVSKGKFFHKLKFEFQSRLGANDFRKSLTGL